jgi:hypothetical protein
LPCFRRCFCTGGSASSVSGVYYNVFAVDGQGERLLVGEGFAGAGQADAAIRMIAGAFGHNAGHANRDRQQATNSYAAATSLTP